MLMIIHAAVAWQVAQTYIENQLQLMLPVVSEQHCSTGTGDTRGALLSLVEGMGLGSCGRAC